PRAYRRSMPCAQGGPPSNVAAAAGVAAGRQRSHNVHPVMTSMPPLRPPPPPPPSPFPLPAAIPARFPPPVCPRCTPTAPGAPRASAGGPASDRGALLRGRRAPSRPRQEERRNDGKKGGGGCPPECGADRGSLPREAGRRVRDKLTLKDDGEHRRTE